MHARQFPASYPHKPLGNFFAVNIASAYFSMIPLAAPTSKYAYFHGSLHPLRVYTIQTTSVVVDVFCSSDLPFG